MFTGFATENTPAIQVWDFGTFPSPPVSSVSLVNDCAPIQVFKTGAQAALISLYLPSAPIEGKIIKIVNVMRGVNGTPIYIYSSDRRGNGSATEIFIIGAGQTLDLCYSKDFITRGTGGATSETGWLSLNFAPPSSANYSSVVLSGEGNSVRTQYASVIGGQNNISSGPWSSVLNGASNTASGQYSAVIGGSSNTASGSPAAVVGSDSSTASGLYSIVSGGFSGLASNSYAAVFGGSVNIASGDSSTAFGGRRGTTRGIAGNFVASASATPIAASSGVSQLGLLVLGRQTTDATATRITSDTNAAGTTNQIILPNNSAYTFQGTCIAAKTAAGDTSSWKFEGAIKRGANAASTVLVAAVTPTVIAQDAGASTWVLAITADTTNGGIAVTVTGQAATTIRWVVKIETTEVTF